MPGLEYRRSDLRLTVRRRDDGGAILTLETPGGAFRRSNTASRRSVERWHTLPPHAVLQELTRRLPFATAARAWRAHAMSEEYAPLFSPGAMWQRLLLRLAIDVSDPGLASLAWEEIFAPWVEDLGRRLFPTRPARVDVGLAVGPVVVRTSPVRPHGTDIAFTLPLRIVILNPQPDHVLYVWINELFGWRPREEVAAAVQVSVRDSLEFTRLSPTAAWPTAEVIHVDDFTATLTQHHSLLSTAATETPYTLGWLERRTDLWQTRLVILNTRRPEDLPAARSLAAALVNRGGPAVLVTADDDRAYLLFHKFYNNLLADLPHDDSLGDLPDFLFPRRRPTLFVGAGREDALRLSGVELRLLSVAREMSDPQSATAEDFRHLVVRATRHRGGRPGRLRTEAALTRIRHTLSGLEQERPYPFEVGRREWLLSLSRRLAEARRAANVEEASAHESTVEEPTSPRFVNASLWAEDGAGGLNRLEQASARLVIGGLYHLGIQLGARDRLVRTVGATALLEEVFKWELGAAGVWLEVGITGLDFEVTGDPVQRLWLPRTHASEMIYFAVSPRVAGAARLRFCLYYQQNVIQSFGLAALVRESPREEELPRGVRRRLLAGALNLAPEDVDDVGYLPSLEYSIVSTLDKVETRPPRALSIVANHDAAGRKHITVKGSDLFFDVRTANDLPGYVRAVRKAMKDATGRVVGQGRHERPLYFWGLGGDENRNVGSEPKLKEALSKLALAGWYLYDQIILEGRRPELARLLAGEGKVISAAHVLLEDVIPWAAVYDRAYRPKMGRCKGVPTAKDVCLVSLPDADGRLPVAECETHPDCLLGEKKTQERLKQDGKLLCEQTVVCPLRFWGFRHLVEVPPHQTGGQVGAVDQKDCIPLAGSPAKMLGGYHGRLRRLATHRAKLDEIAARPDAGAVWVSKSCVSDEIIELLEEPTLDLVYLYCHARGGTDDPAATFPPELEFCGEGQGDEPSAVASADFAYGQKWVHNPLIFLNGCGTGGFSPDALSPFIHKLVTERGAAGVVATEVPVWEQFATEFAEVFLSKFLVGRPAGNAMLETRRVMLSKKNPLGLIYTLYAATQLALDKAGDGSCGRRR